MNLCQKAVNKEGTLVSEVVLSKPHKFSLKEGKFKPSQTQPGLSKRSWKDGTGSNKFVSFMEEHNNLLAKKCKMTGQIKSESQVQTLGCFDLNCHGDSNDFFISKLRTKHQPSTSTMSSSKISEVATYQPNYQEYQKKFKINTKSILQQLIKEGHCISERKRISSEYDTNSSKVSLKEEREKRAIVDDWQTTSLPYSDNKNHKISLKKKNPQINEDNFTRKESLSYHQLSSPLGLSNEFDEFTLTNLKVSVIIEQYPNFSHERNLSLSDCECSSPCKWINKWLSQLDTSKIKVLKRVNVDEKTLIQIDKDTPRTQKHPLFASQYYRQHLRDVLVCYSSLRPQIGYVQGMNFIASTLIYHTKDFNKSSTIFNCLMIQRQFQKIYQEDFALLTHLTDHLLSELERYSPSLFKKINQCEIELQVFSRGWYLSMLGSFVPLEFMHLVIDKFHRKSFKGLNQLLLTLLLYLKQELLSADFDELATKLSNSWLSLRSKKINWQQLLASSDNVMMKEFIF